MKLQIKQALEALSWNKIVKDEKLINKVLWSLKSRNDKHWKLFLSRKEFKKFWTTEKKLRKIIEWLRAIWLLEYVWRERKEWNKYTSCVYKATTILSNIFEMLVWGIKDLYVKVWNWVRSASTRPIEILKQFWVDLEQERYWLIDGKVYLNKRNWLIKDFKNDKWYNLYSYLMELKWLTCLELAKELKL